jgi:Rrf2 family protein
MLTRTAQYALRATIELARQPEGESVTASRLANVIRIPANYLSKILHDLVRAGLLDSTRGSSGGFRLARPAERITVADVAGIFQDVSAQRRCLLGRRECRDATACPVHDAWKRVAEPVWAFFRETTMADLAPKIEAEDPASLNLQPR